MRKAPALIAFLFLVGIATLLPAGPARALGFNTAMLYRYPWIGAQSMSRTQAWGGTTSHYGSLQYAVDWDNGSGNWLVHAANGGEIKRCDPAGGDQGGFGNFIGVYNSVAAEMSIAPWIMPTDTPTPTPTKPGNRR